MRRPRTQLGMAAAAGLAAALGACAAQCPAPVSLAEIRRVHVEGGPPKAAPRSDALASADTLAWSCLRGGPCIRVGQFNGAGFYNIADRSVQFACRDTLRRVAVMHEAGETVVVYRCEVGDLIGEFRIVPKSQRRRCGRGQYAYFDREVDPGVGRATDMSLADSDNLPGPIEPPEEGSEF